MKRLPLVLAVWLVGCAMPGQESARKPSVEEAPNAYTWGKGRVLTPEEQLKLGVQAPGDSTAPTLEEQVQDLQDEVRDLKEQREDDLIPEVKEPNY